MMNFYRSTGCRAAAFRYVLDLFSNHPVFYSKKKWMAPAAHQLMVFLKYVGTEGTGASNSNQRATFGVGCGTASLYRKRVTKAIRELRSEYIKWPDSEKRKTISREINAKYDFHHCVELLMELYFPWHLNLTQRMLLTTLEESMDTP